MKSCTLNEGAEGVSLWKHDPRAELGGHEQFQEPSTCENKAPGHIPVCFREKDRVLVASVYRVIWAWRRRCVTCRAVIL